MHTSRTLGLLIALVPLAAAAEDHAADADSAPVATLKASLQSTLGFKVDTVRTTDAGVSCITYRVSNSKGGESHAQAVVEGDQVLRSTSGHSKFAKAWNSKCVGSSGTK
jgi:hypothetical protein